MNESLPNFSLTTPQGNELIACVDDGQVRNAKVIDHYTGIMRPLDEKVANYIRNAVQARDISARTRLEAESIRETIKGFGAAATMLGTNNPALRPYHDALNITGQLVSDMLMQAEDFESKAADAADKLANKG